MRIASYIGLIVGLGIFIALVVWQGFGDLADLLLASGWPLLLVPAIWFPTVLMNARCWQVLFEIKSLLLVFLHLGFGIYYWYVSYFVVGFPAARVAEAACSFISEKD